jgi:peptidoglycan hydrolase-like protein with peptidoglycan-binding domain
MVEEPMSLRALQRRLKVLGLYHGAVTGDANKALREAIKDYRDSAIRDDEVERLLEERARG